MKKILLFTVLILAILGGVGYWFWSLGIVPAEPARIAVLTVEAPGVQVQKQAGGEWVQGTSGMQLFPGWSLRTDLNGRASIRFFNQGETRLSQSTTIRISAASFQGTGVGQTTVAITLEAGRIWNRVLKLLDIGSSYKVNTSHVVATVRGTSFDMIAHSDGVTDVMVGDSAVSVANLGGKHATSVAEGMLMQFNEDGSVKNSGLISDAQRLDPWVMTNELADTAFADTESMNQTNALRRLGGVGPDSALYGISQLSERLHVALAKGSEKGTLTEQYLSRRFYHLIELVQSGKTGLAAQEFSQVDATIKSLPDTVSGQSDRVHIANALSRVNFLVQNTDPSNTLYPFKQRMENLTVELALSDPSTAFYVRMLALDARLDEASRAITRSSFDEAQISLDGVADGIANIRRDSASLLLTLPEEQRSAIEDKLASLSARENMMRYRLETAVTIQNQASSSTNSGALPRPGDTGLSPSATTTFSESTAKQQFSSIELTVSMNPIQIGKIASLNVNGIAADGSKINITAMTQFMAGQGSNLVSINGPTLKGLKDGDATIKAMYENNGSPLTAEKDVTINGKVEISEFILSSLPPSPLLIGDQTKFVANIRYNTGEIQNVTADTNFVIASGGGSIVRRTFTAPTQAGITTISGSYTTTDGITLIGSMNIKTINAATSSTSQ